MTPPVARREPVVHRLHGRERRDEYHWLRDRGDPEVPAYLEAENAYTQAMTAHTEGLREKLFSEIRSRVQETDESAPFRDGGFWYYKRTVEGLQYEIHCRKDGSEVEHVLLDENALARGHDYFQLGALVGSPDHSLLAYSTDVRGDEAYTLRIRNLASGLDLPDEVPNTGADIMTRPRRHYGVEWAADNATLYYNVLDEARRPWQVWRHTLGSHVRDDVLVYQEDDDAFHLSLFKTRSCAFLLVVLTSAVTTEVRFLRTDDPAGELRVVRPREHELEYSVEHHGDSFFILTNDNAKNFRVVEAPIAAPGTGGSGGEPPVHGGPTRPGLSGGPPDQTGGSGGERAKRADPLSGKESWREIVPHRTEVRLEDIDAFAGHLVLYERAGGMRRIAVHRLSDGDTHVVEQPEPVYTVRAGDNPEFDTRIVRFVYTSLVTPPSVIDYDMDERTRTVRKQEPVPGYDPELYETERTWATAPDGAGVPVSLVHRRNLVREGTAPTLLYGYGAYEYCSEPEFLSYRVSLLDRGFVFAVAHVRGGGEMGRAWYDDGKLLRKTNTFTDFVACAEHLIEQGYTAAERLVIHGGSAGGLLIGAVLNMRPELFGAAVAEVPFVDALNTMLDPSLPLTVIEWEEWGNPEETEAYDYMQSYSPYDNVRATGYPKMLVTAGINDPRVSYWEPAKWVARLRATKTDSNPLLLKTEMGAGHFGPSGRYESWREEAFIYSFILDAVGVSD